MSSKLSRPPISSVTEVPFRDARRVSTKCRSGMPEQTRRKHRGHEPLAAPDRVDRSSGTTAKGRLNRVGCTPSSISAKNL